MDQFRHCRTTRIIFHTAMDSQSANWLSDLGMDEYNIIHHCHMNSLAELTAAQDHITTAERSTQQLSILSFEKPTSLPKDETVSSANMNFSPMKPIKNDAFENTIHVPKINQGFKRSYSMTRSHAHAQDHILAERKRREKLSQRLIALSAIIPGLKKMDKASVLGDAIKYVKQLQERVKVLEEKTKNRTVESVVFVKKSLLSSDEESSSCEENSNGQSSDLVLPEIEARFSDDDVLIRIHCEKQQGIVAKILNEFDDLHLSVVDSTVLSFGDSTLDITIIAQKDDEFKLTVKDLVKDIRVAFLKFM
ncbi:hypothetical protein V6N13_086597 [Hibiscus sabdariffa]|uniref:BHLH domain-containing protein n=1 Tax=Hibiscus sabdariffa TaxID=183260 RepID=A0ABR2FTN6_9ROSI